MIGLGWGGAWVDEVTCEMEPAQDKQAGILPCAGADPVTFVLAGWSWFCVFTLAGVAYSSWAVSFATGPPAGFLVLGGGAAILGTYAEYALTTAAFLVFLVRRRWAWAAQLLPVVLLVPWFFAAGVTFRVSRVAEMALNSATFVRPLARDCVRILAYRLPVTRARLGGEVGPGGYLSPLLFPQMRGLQRVRPSAIYRDGGELRILGPVKEEYDFVPCPGGFRLTWRPHEGQKAHLVWFYPAPNRGPVSTSPVGGGGGREKVTSTDSNEGAKN